MSSNRRPRPAKPSRDTEEDTATPPQGEVRETPIPQRHGSRSTREEDTIEWEEDYDGLADSNDPLARVIEVPITWKELPTAVRKSAEAFFQRTTGFTCVRLDRGTHAAFIVEIGDDLARELDCPPVSLTLAPSGMLIEVARAIHPEDLPSQVRDSMATHYKGIQFEGAEEVTMHFFELAYVVGEETRVVQVDSSGVILSDEVV